MGVKLSALSYQHIKFGWETIDAREGDFWIGGRKDA